MARAETKADDAKKGCQDGDCPFLYVIPISQFESDTCRMALLNFRDRSAATGGEKGGGHASSLTSGKTNAQ